MGFGLSDAWQGLLAPAPRNLHRFTNHIMAGQHLSMQTDLVGPMRSLHPAIEVEGSWGFKV